MKQAELLKTIGETYQQLDKELKVRAVLFKSLQGIAKDAQSLVEELNAL